MPHHNASLDLDAAIAARARRRVGLIISWLIHTTVFVAVNIGISLLAWSQGRHWDVYPLMGWGLGLFAHGLMVWLAQPIADWRARWLEREMAQLRAQSRRPPQA